MPVTRRSVLCAMARLGGAGAVYETLAAWDFLKPPPALAASAPTATTMPKARSPRARCTVIMAA